MVLILNKAKVIIFMTPPKKIGGKYDKLLNIYQQLIKNRGGYKKAVAVKEA